MNPSQKHVLVTGGAGYIGSLLTAQLLQQGHLVTVIDNLLFGGESLMTFLSHPNFHFFKADITETRSLRDSLPRTWPRPDVIFHLAGIAGFPACQAIGKQAAWFYNVDGVKNLLDQAESLKVGRFIFPSTYSAYAASPDGSPVSEESPLNPQSLYGETMIAAEDLLLPQGALVFRLATLYGVSPRTRFDLIEPVCVGCVHQALTSNLPARVFKIFCACARCCARLDAGHGCARGKNSRSGL